MDGAPPILILTGLRTEARAIRRSLRSRGLDADARIRSVGVGGASLAGVVDEEQAATLTHGAVIVAGLGGALDPGLRRGEVIVDAPPRCVAPRDGVRFGTIHTASTPVATPADKACLFRTCGADVVEMEQRLVRDAFAAARAGPDAPAIIGVRSVLDTAREPLAPWLTTLSDAHGRVRPARVARRVAARPRSALTLARLAPAARLALRRLGACVADIVAALLEEQRGAPERRAHPAGARS